MSKLESKAASIRRPDYRSARVPRWQPAPTEREAEESGAEDGEA